MPVSSPKESTTCTESHSKGRVNRVFQQPASTVLVVATAGPATDFKLGVLLFETSRSPVPIVELEQVGRPGGAPRHRGGRYGAGRSTVFGASRFAMPPLAPR